MDGGESKVFRSRMIKYRDLLRAMPVKVWESKVAQVYDVRLWERLSGQRNHVSIGQSVVRKWGANGVGEDVMA